MTVPMVKLSVIKAAKPGRRGKLRQASRGNKGLRIAATKSVKPTTAVTPMSPKSSASCESPKRLRTADHSRPLGKTLLVRELSIGVEFGYARKDPHSTILYRYDFAVAHPHYAAGVG